MKKLFISVLAIFGFSLIVFLLFPKKVGNEDKRKVSKESVLSKKESISPTNFQVFFEDEYRILKIKISDLRRLSLHSNLGQKLFSQEALKEKGCEKLISAGFYSNNGFIGLFASNGTIISKAVKNKTFNGYFYIHEDSAYISKESPSLFLHALQAGPIVFSNGKATELSMKNDENARRILVATTKNPKEIFFLAIHNKENFLSGPKLSELPKVLEKINQEENLGIVDALNLDGGTHSAFLLGEENLFEVATIGGFFCIKS